MYSASDAKNNKNEIKDLLDTIDTLTRARAQLEDSIYPTARDAIDAKLDAVRKDLAIAATYRQI